MAEAIFKVRIHLELENLTQEELVEQLEQELNRLCTRMENKENYQYVSYAVIEQLT